MTPLEPSRPILGLEMHHLRCVFEIRISSYDVVVEHSAYNVSFSITITTALPRSLGVHDTSLTGILTWKPRFRARSQHKDLL